MGYSSSHPPEPVGEDEAERRALEAAVAEARADYRSAPRIEVCGWLLRLALGKSDAPSPTVAPADDAAGSRSSGVFWRAAALADVERFVNCAPGESPIDARRLAQELVFAGDALEFFPCRGRPGFVAGTRELSLLRSYVLIYEVREDDTLIILRVWLSTLDR